MLELLHSFLWVVDLHLAVLEPVSYLLRHAGHVQVQARTVMIFFPGRTVTSLVEALRFPSFAVSRGSVLEGMVNTAYDESLALRQDFQTSGSGLCNSQRRSQESREWYMDVLSSSSGNSGVFDRPASWE